MVSEERRSFHCFGCGKGGDIFTFVMEMEGIGFREALERLAEKAGVQLKRGDLGYKRDQGKEKAKLFQILELATKWYEKNLWEGKGKEKILRYLRERGLTDESIKKFRLGYAPDGWNNMLNFLKGRNYKIEEIAKTGLLVEKNREERNISNTKYQIPNTRHYDRFRDRIIFPIQDIMGRVVGLSARVSPGGDEKTAKYINTPQAELYDKSKILYGLNLAKAEIKKRDEAILVEGNTDVIASHQAGFGNAIAVSGTAITLEQIKTIKRYTENLKMAFDMDIAGQAAAKKSARICLENDLNVRIVLLSKGKDVADIIREEKSLWEKAVAEARGIVEYFFENAFSQHDAKSPTGKKKIAQELLNVLKDIADPVEKSHWVKVLAEKLDVKEETLVEILRKAKSEANRTGEEKKETRQDIEKEKAVEKRIIGLLAAFPRETEKQREVLSSDDFFGKEEKEIIQKITRGNTDFDKVKNLVSGYEAQKLIDEAIFEVEVDREEGRIPHPANELGKALKRHKKSRIKKKIAEISCDIKEAEKAGDKERLKELMEEFRNLSEGLGE